MQVTILGSGTGYPDPTRERPGILFRIGTAALLFDAGSGTLGRLLRQGVSLDDLDHILFTHRHTDHCADLLPILQACHLMSRSQPLTIVASRTFLDYVEMMIGLHPWVQPRTYVLQRVDIGEGVFRGPEWTVSAIRSEHTADSLCFRLSAEGKSIVYTGDARAAPALTVFSQGVDLLIAECSFPDELADPIHLSPSQIGPIAEEAGVKHLLLTHFYPPCDQVDIRGQVAKWYSGPISLAREGTTLEI